MRTPKAFRGPLDSYEQEHGPAALALLVDGAEEPDRFHMNQGRPRLILTGRWVAWHERTGTVRGLDHAHPLHGFKARVPFDLERDRLMFTRLEAEPFAGTMDLPEARRILRAFEAFERRRVKDDETHGVIEPGPHGAGRWFARLAGATGARLLVVDTDDPLRAVPPTYDDAAYRVADAHALQNVCGVIVATWRRSHEEATADA